MAQETEVLEEIVKLQDKVNSVTLPPELKERILLMVKRLGRMIKYGGYSTEYERTAYYIEWITSLPWVKRSEDALDLTNAEKILNKNHYGLQEVKDRILEYLAVLALRVKKGKKIGSEAGEGILKFMRAPIIALVGLVGTGKTTLAYSIAEAMGREFARVPFGGMGSALDLRGQSRVHPDAEVGLIIKAIKRCGSKNPVILLDEIDRVGDEARADIMGVLVELLDPEQNMAFRDHFIDYPFDLSEVLFIATCNNTANIATAVMDRIEPIRMPSYTDQEKITIGRDFILPKVLKESGLEEENLIIDEDVWPKIVRPLGYDAGIRTLGRTINGVCRKIARTIVEGKETRFHITNENVKQFLPSW
ncbi:MAG TPA: AAA family ATPase [Candidatus Bathyarchaeia archaeon]|nr:AAA family ATPase [Candidatus Bathyarchaeia archaeon]